MALVTSPIAPTCASKRPRPLRPGDLVRVVCPGFPAMALMPVARRARAEAALARLGLRVSYGRHAFAMAAHAAGSAAQRAEDINEAFADDDVAAVLCAIGGLHCLDVLPLLDFRLIAAHPKIVAGHSSNLPLLLAILVKTGLPPFYPLTFGNHFGEYPSPFVETLAAFQAACMGSQPLHFRPLGPRTDAPHLVWWKPDFDAYTRERVHPGGWRWLRPGRARGPLIGGYLGALADLMDTEWMPPFTGAVVHWDATNLVGNTAAVDAMLAALHRRGCLAAIAGLVVGYPTRLPARTWLPSLDEVVLKWTADLDGPVLVDADLGHTDPTWIAPLGVSAQLDSEGDAFWCEPGTSG